MKRGVYAVLVGCLLINVLVSLDQPYYLFTYNSPKLSNVVVNINIGLALLFFPLIRVLADVCYTRYQLMKTSFAILSTTLIFFLIVGIILHFAFQVILQKSISKQVPVVDILCAVFVISGIGLFDANAMQFGMDQLLEACSTQLSQFIHWYFWFMLLGQSIVFFVLLMSLLMLSFLNTAYINIEELHLILDTVTALLVLLWLICLLLASYLFHEEKRNMYICCYTLYAYL